MEIFLSALWPCLILLGISFALGYGFGDWLNLPQEVQDGFKSDNSSIYLTDSKVRYFDNSFKAAFKRKIKQSIIFTVVYVVTYVSIRYAFPSAFESNSSGDFWLYFFSWPLALYTYLRLGAAKSLLDLTNPLTPDGRKKLEYIVLDCDDSERLIAFINANPKAALVGLDLLNIKYQADLIDEQLSNTENAAILATLEK